MNTQFFLMISLSIYKNYYDLVKIREESYQNHILTYELKKIQI